MNMRKIFLALLSSGLFASMGAAKASIIADFLSEVSSISHPGAFDYTYRLTLSADEQMATGSFVVLYDFGPALNPIPTSAQGIAKTNFLASQQLVGPTLPSFVIPDSPTVLNYVMTYTGATLSGFALNNGAIGNLGTFVVTSPFAAFTVGFEASRAQVFNPTGTNTGTTDDRVAGVTLPSAGRPASVPEPATIALLGIALAAAGVTRRRMA